MSEEETTSILYRRGDESPSHGFDFQEELGVGTAGGGDHQIIEVGDTGGVGVLIAGVYTMSCWLGLTDDPQLSNSLPLQARSRQSSFLKTTVKGPHKVQKALAYALIIGLYKLAPGILIIRWCYQINLRDLLKGKINQDVVYDKRYLLALYVILWASSILINFSIKCASYTKNLADSVAINNDDEPDRILSKVFDRIKEQSWSRHAGIGKEVEFFTKLTMFVGAIVGFAFSNIYVSSKLSNFMEWAHHVSQLLYLAVACMTPFFYVASGVKKLHEAHEIFVCQARRAQVEKLCKSSTNAAVPLEWEKWSVIIDTMRERVVSIVNTEKELCWTAFATMGAILWHLLGHLNKFDDAPKGIIETERFALTYMISFTLILVILTVLAVIFGFDMVPQFVKAGNRQGHLRVILCSFPVGGVALAVVYLPWHYLKYITCKL
ncbi:hypothetical protein Bbelb_389100 [Branchiostoma belcheri]|nr:hypothetical protein Bbelb_389100 [Branchiostoma belcheri]